MRIKCGLLYRVVTEKELEKLNTSKNTQFAREIARVEPGGWLLLQHSYDSLDKIYDFQFTLSDVLLMGFPETGTTWTMEILWNLLHNSNLDNSKAHSSIDIRCPELGLEDMRDGTPTKPVFSFDKLGQRELLSRRPHARQGQDLYLQLAESAPNPRTFKTHVPFPFFRPDLLDKCQVVYVMRNAKDTIISLYQYVRLYNIFSFNGDIDTFVDFFINNLVLCTPFWLHLKTAWEKRHHPNLLICYYEDLKANTKAEVTRMHDFLGLKLTEKQLDQIISFTSFAKLKERVTKAKNENFFNPEVPMEGFFRKDENGDGEKSMSAASSKKVDEWIKKNMEGFDSDFKYKI